MAQSMEAPINALLGNRRVVLGSQSPRRIQLLGELGLHITVRPSEVEEVYPESLPIEEVAPFLSRLKADSLRPSLSDEEILITADTVVLLEGELLGKPTDLDHARDFLHRLSGKINTVITGYTIMDAHGKVIAGQAVSKIKFAPLEESEIEYYIRRCEVLDKAGAYGVQDWIGLIAVEDIQGSYNNIIGLPTALIYRDLKAFLSK
ncbi:Maf family nucleotide pyrophosphatase [Porphyromonas cangingivalis]|uniref:dTTP/UTP pyrophosphatase n=2 Tax=Porphyromonas cangingivalis TaxID=36874 RepID=A0A1T4K4P0_PORCN|nr:Maf family nucleotide pyrophosphatase [Porphyromonas cangingivalis]SJZ37313.1 septum formation protein [Porphyromonas cangingivalis]VEJ03451.1 Septum formation protein Maf [Porphyromonas cangingivalis]